MADDKNKDLDPEEENNDAFEDDDFGLPDLEYDELDDDEFDDEFDTPEFDDSSETPSEEDASGDAAAAELEEALRVEDAFGDLDEELDDEFSDEIDDESTDDIEGEYEVDDLEDLDAELDSNQFDISDDELQKELEELENEDIDFSDIENSDEEGSADDEFYEQESFEEFSEDNSMDSVFGDDDIDDAVKEEQVLVSGSATGSGPKRDMTAKQKAANHYSQAYAESQGNKGKFAKIVIIGTVVILVIASALWLAYDGSDGKQEIAKTEQPKPAPRKQEPKPAAETPKQETAKPEPKPVTKPAATPSQVPAGTVNQLESRTGKAYVIIASFVDGDLALDHANKLAGDGKSPYVIPPFNNGLYYRVAIAEFQTFADATQNIGRYKEEFGQDIWTLRY